MLVSLIFVIIIVIIIICIIMIFIFIMVIVIVLAFLMSSSSSVSPLLLLCLAAARELGEDLQLPVQRLLGPAVGGAQQLLDAHDLARVAVDALVQHPVGARPQHRQLDPGALRHVGQNRGEGR